MLGLGGLIHGRVEGVSFKHSIRQFKLTYIRGFHYKLAPTFVKKVSVPRTPPKKVVLAILLGRSLTASDPSLVHWEM